MHEHFDSGDVITPITDEVMKSAARVMPIKLPPGVFETDPIPRESAEVVVQDILTLIEQLGYAPDQVLVSGYQGSGAHDSKSEETFSNDYLLDSTREQIESCEKELQEISSRIEAGKSVSPDAMQIYQSSIDESRQLLELLTENPDLHQYFFGLAANLTDMSDYGVGGSHPVGYASIGGVIGLYDRKKIEALMVRNTSDEEGLHTVYATPEEIQDALLVEYSPRFVENE